MRALVLLLPLFLAACGGNPFVVRTTHQVVVPEESMFSCPTIEQLPESKTLTDIQVARLLVTLYQNNTQCKNSLLAIQKFLEEAKKTASQKD
jgi:hypothetical protein